MVLFVGTIAESNSPGIKWLVTCSKFSVEVTQLISQK